MFTDVLETGNATDVKYLTKRLQRFGKNDATDYRVDVCMDLLGHTSRTVLSDSEFHDLQSCVKYAFEKTTAPVYEITRKSGVRVNGDRYVVYKLTFVK
jgi:hypothetical protein